MTLRHTLILLATSAALALSAAAVFTLTARTTNPTPERIYLPSPTSYQALTDSLHAHHLIDRHQAALSLLARTAGLHSHIAPGSYLVAPRTPLPALARTLARGQQTPIRLTLGKFRTPDQLNHYLNLHLMADSFAIPLDSLHLIRPDTYELYWTTAPEVFLRRMHREYDRFWSRPAAGTSTPRADLLKSLHPALTAEQAIILASIIEEETNNAQEKPLIASVYLNRLSHGIPLQADPTVKYAVGDFTLRRILAAHLHTPSPFNTYLHPGLPPAPICTPSASSVDALLAAPATPYLYFCASPAMDGTHRFAATLTQHQHNAALFHAALNRRGIH
ncbi:MAG: endolytic transglycosylase MltG [Bacteroidales bacterium]|nr:endolytic transglycosylase MltG [Bacteroidales bacterium]